MKKIALLLILITLFKGQNASAQVEPVDQVFQASFDSSGSNLIFTITPTQTITTQISYMQFSIGFPTGSPAFSVTNIASNTATFPGLVMDSNISYYVSGGYTYYTYTSNAGVIIPNPPATTTYTAGTPYTVFTLSLSGAPGTTANFRLASDSTLEASSSGASYDFVMYNGSGNLISAPAGSELSPAPVPSGTGVFIPIAAVSLPVTFTTFAATLQNDNADLTWTVANESAATKYYAVQKSIDNGLTYSTIDTVLITNPNAPSNTYSYIDTDLSSVKAASNTIYYRIKQVDANGTFMYSATDIIKLPSQVDPTVTVYPNPVQDFATVKFDLDEDAPVTMNLTDVNGKILQSTQLQGTIGENKPSINMSALVNGNYVLSLNIGGVAHVFPLVKAN